MNRLADGIYRRMAGLSSKQMEAIKAKGKHEAVRHQAKDRRNHAAEKGGRPSNESRTKKKKLKHRSERGEERPQFPQAEGPPKYGGLSDCPLYGIVMPMAHGKSTLAQAEGWIDCDSLLTPGARKRLSGQVLEKLGDGADYEVALEDMVQLMSKALQVMAPSKPTIILSHSRELLIGCGIRPLAILSLEESVFEQNMRLRDDAEKYAARISKRYLEACEQEFEPLIVVQDNEYMRQVVYQIADSVGVELGAPKLNDPEYPLPDGIGGEESCDLNKLVDMHERGMVSTAVVNYQINLQGLKAYRGYGFTANDWATTAAHLVDSTSAGDPVIPTLDNWPLTLEAIGKSFDMSEDVDGQALLAAHGGEDEAFILGLLLHWKLYGIQNDTTGRLRLLYYVRRTKWDIVMRKIRQGVLGSGTFMGEPITLIERDILLSLHMLSATTKSALMEKWRTEKMGYPTSRPSRELQGNYTDIIPKLVVQVPASDPHYEREAWDIFLKGNIQPLQDCWKGLLGEGPLRRKHVIAYLLGVRLLNEWEGEQGSLRIVREAMKQVATNWFRVGKIRDEWFDFTAQILDGECKADDKIAQMAVMMVKTPSCQGLSGAPWGVRVSEAVQRIVIVGWCGSRLGNSVALQDFGEGPMPVVLGHEEAAYVSEMMKIGAPKYMTSVAGSEESVISTLSELVDWSRSGVGLVLEIVNSGSWLGSLSQKEKIALISNWAVKRDTRGVDPELLGVLLEKFTKRWLGRSYTSKLVGQLQEMMQLSRRDGGLGTAKMVFRGSIKLGEGSRTWDGRSSPVIKGAGERKKREIDLEASSRVLTAKQLSPKWSAYSLSMCGSLVSSFLLGGEKADAEAMCVTIDAIKDCRPHALQSIPGVRASCGVRRGHGEWEALADAVVDDCIAMLSV
ncbi:hypothetical protein PrCV1_s3gp1 [Penicillium raistrickii chrysovirus 1]|nr:hypothetical protein PrCV1_s3gp1 [Penicillium raistrickii chrysovirus 1]